MELTHFFRTVSGADGGMVEGGCNSSVIAYVGISPSNAHAISTSIYWVGSRISSSSISVSLRRTRNVRCITVRLPRRLLQGYQTVRCAPYRKIRTKSVFTRWRKWTPIMSRLGVTVATLPQRIAKCCARRTIEPRVTDSFFA